MTASRDRLSVAGLSFCFYRRGGNIAEFTIQTKGGHVLQPLHTAPWAAGPDSLPGTVDLVERRLAGDFFCAPFGVGEGLPIHGWTANGLWEESGTTVTKDGVKTVCYTLEEKVQGAEVEKSFTLVPGHPFLYQRHRFTGGNGHLPIAHHAMIRVPGGARLGFSRKQFGVTPREPLESVPERGFSKLAYPQEFAGLNSVETGSGESVDARNYPFSEGHEDIVVLAEEPGGAIGWSAALAREDGFLFFAIKDARVLSETLLWMSNGGRNYPPWSGRHTAVLGIEEAATHCHEKGDFSSSAGRSNSGRARGLDLAPGTTTDIRYGFGAIPVPDGWSEVADIRTNSRSLVLEDTGGAAIMLPFRGAHFGL